MRSLTVGGISRRSPLYILVADEIQHTLARSYIKHYGVVLHADPPAFPRLTLFPAADRALRPLRRWRYDLHRFWSRRRAT